MKHSSQKRELNSGFSSASDGHLLQHCQLLSGDGKQKKLGQYQELKTAENVFNCFHQREIQQQQRPMQQLQQQQHHQHQYKPEQQSPDHIINYRSQHNRNFPDYENVSHWSHVPPEGLQYQHNQDSYRPHSSQPSQENSSNQRILNTGSDFDSSERTTLSQMEEQFEDIDDDNISDYEEEEQMRQIYNSRRERVVGINVASSLLQFADRVTTELQKCFSRTKDHDDSCDIYEDKWATTKSGRELYYADLLRIAQGDAESSNKSSKKGSKSSSVRQSPDNEPAPLLNQIGNNENKYNFKGVREASLGLGPLAELFEFGLKNGSCEPILPVSDTTFRSKDMPGSYGYLNMTSSFQTQLIGGQGHTTNNMIPMQGRGFPESFWTEPKTDVGKEAQDMYYSSKCDPPQKGTYLVTQKLPDFTDLMESWQGGTEKLHTESDRANQMVDDSNQL